MPWDRIVDLVCLPINNLIGGTAYHVVAIRYVRYEPRYVYAALPPFAGDARVRAIGLWALAAMTSSGAILVAARIGHLIADNYPEPDVQGATRV